MCQLNFAPIFENRGIWKQIRAGSRNSCVSVGHIIRTIFEPQAVQKASLTSFVSATSSSGFSVEFLLKTCGFLNDRPHYVQLWLSSQKQQLELYSAQIVALSFLVKHPARRYFWHNTYGIMFSNQRLNKTVFRGRFKIKNFNPMTQFRFFYMLVMQHFNMQWVHLCSLRLISGNRKQL